MRIVVTGGNGFLGTEVVKEVKKQFPAAEVIVPSSKEVDLREREAAINFFNEIAPDYVIAIAARLGGIGDNRKYPATYFYDNISIGINTIDLKKASPLLSLSVSHPTINPKNKVKKTTKTNQIIWFLIDFSKHSIAFGFNDGVTAPLAKFIHS